MMIAIDAGNTRIKWGVHNGSEWVALGALPTADVALLAEVSTGWPEGAQVVACNVAGEAVGEAIRMTLAPRFSPVNWLKPSAAACGVRNGYDHPERLGADRWAALIGARGKVSHACLVVCAGTATTVDLLDATGRFRGGLILPGVDLMRKSLASNTAQLPLAEGDYRSEPSNTMDAIVSGCLHAQAGAIERLFSRLSSEPEALCLLTGGAAPHITPLLNIPFQLKENLILDGLVRFGTSR